MGILSTTPASRLQIGQKLLPGRAVLAPMSGVTDAGMRRIAHRFGASLVVSEMIGSDQLVHREAVALLRIEGDGISPHMVQIAGCDPQWMAEGAICAEAAGADIIDINMGCPAKRVINGWSGSALMRDLDHAARLIEATVNAVKVPVTLKMRLGWDHSSLNAPELARRAEDLGVQLITVHGRTRQQFYKGHADWSAVRATREATRLPLVVNGDISTSEQAKAALEASGADMVMIGRAAMGRPWLVGEIGHLITGEPWQKPDKAAMAAAAVEHYEALVRTMGVRVGLRHARKHVAAYLEEAARYGAEMPSPLKCEIMTSESPDFVMAQLMQAFSFCGAGSKQGRAAA